MLMFWSETSRGTFLSSTLLTTSSDGKGLTLQSQPNQFFLQAIKTVVLHKLVQKAPHVNLPFGQSVIYTNSQTEDRTCPLFDALFPVPGERTEYCDMISLDAKLTAKGDLVILPIPLKSDLIPLAKLKTIPPTVWVSPSAREAKYLGKVVPDEKAVQRIHEAINNILGFSVDDSTGHSMIQLDNQEGALIWPSSMLFARESTKVVRSYRADLPEHSDRILSHLRGKQPNVEQNSASDRFELEVANLTSQLPVKQEIYPTPPELLRSTKEGPPPQKNSRFSVSSIEDISAKNTTPNHDDIMEEFLVGPAPKDKEFLGDSMMLNNLEITDADFSYFDEGFDSSSRPLSPIKPISDPEEIETDSQLLIHLQSPPQSPKWEPVDKRLREAAPIPSKFGAIRFIYDKQDNQQIDKRYESGGAFWFPQSSDDEASDGTDFNAVGDLESLERKRKRSFDETEEHASTNTTRDALERAIAVVVSQGTSYVREEKLHTQIDLFAELSKLDENDLADICKEYQAQIIPDACRSTSTSQKDTSPQAEILVTEILREIFHGAISSLMVKDMVSGDFDGAAKVELPLLLDEPQFTVAREGFDYSLLEVDPSALGFWNKYRFSPISEQKSMTYFTISTPYEGDSYALQDFLGILKLSYETSNLGRCAKAHVEGMPASLDLRNGEMSVSLKDAFGQIGRSMAAFTSPQKQNIVLFFVDSISNPSSIFRICRYFIRLKTTFREQSGQLLANHNLHLQIIPSSVLYESQAITHSSISHFRQFAMRLYDMFSAHPSNKDMFATYLNSPLPPAPNFDLPNSFDGDDSLLKSDLTLHVGYNFINLPGQTSPRYLVAFVCDSCARRSLSQLIPLTTLGKQKRAVGFTMIQAFSKILSSCGQVATLLRRSSDYTLVITKYGPGSMQRDEVAHWIDLTSAQNVVLASLESQRALKIRFPPDDALVETDSLSPTISYETPNLLTPATQESPDTTAMQVSASPRLSVPVDALPSNLIQDFEDTIVHDASSNVYAASFGYPISFELAQSQSTIHRTISSAIMYTRLPNNTSKALEVNILHHNSTPAGSIRFTKLSTHTQLIHEILRDFRNLISVTKQRSIPIGGEISLDTFLPWHIFACTRFTRSLGVVP